MNDLPIGRPANLESRRPTVPDDMPRQTHDLDRTPGTPRARLDSRPVGFGSAIGTFAALMVLFILAAAVAQFVVRGDRDVGNAPTAPPVAQDQTPAQPSPPADGNPAGSTSRDAVTP